MDRSAFDKLQTSASSRFNLRQLDVPNGYIFATLGKNAGYTCARVENGLNYPGTELPGHIIATQKNADGSLEIYEEDCWNGFVPASKFGELLIAAVANKQDTFTIVSDEMVAYTICTTEARATK